MVDGGGEEDCVDPSSQEVGERSPQQLRALCQSISKEVQATLHASVLYADARAGG